MKKSLIFAAAASALMLTACSSENDVVQTATQPQPVVQQAVGFNVYTPAATNVTRAGLEGTMTTTRMQRTKNDGGGFGVYAFLTEDVSGGTGEASATSYSPTDPSSKANVPNFMVNEMVLWDKDSQGWYYNPLKYWPNETDNDSQATPATMPGGSSSHTDRLTFFAYAPYVSAGTTTGITDVTDNAGQLGGNNTSDPTISWKATTADATFKPNEGVDLLWGVAPSGGLSYTAVNGWTVTRDEGKPLINMIKPNVNTSMKFLFNHALARFGVNVVAAVDQVSPGGELDPNTKITIESLKIKGKFGTVGELNLNNDGNPGIANWTKINSTSITSSTTVGALSSSTITVTANDATPDNNAIAKNLRWTSPHNPAVIQPVVGVTPAKQDLLIRSDKWYTKLASKPAYNPAKQYFTEAAGVYTEAKATATITGGEGYYELSGNDYNKKAAGTINSPAFPEAVGTNYVTITPTSYTAGTNPGIAVGTTKLYTEDGSGNYIYVCTYAELAADVTAAGGNWAAAGSSIYNPATTYCSIVTTVVPLSSIAFTYPDDTYYEAERNYLYVIPTNNVWKQNTGLGDNPETLRTITVTIEYYITTEDSKLAAGRAQTKNVVTKEVVLPSLANGKTYMLNLVLGLTSVKVEAEVSDWKVENVNADLPQNTDGD